jgi:hypothetical protein
VREYASGTVAMVETPTGPTVCTMAVPDHHSRSPHWHVASGCGYWLADSGLDARRLVVLDWLVHDLRQAADTLAETGRFNGTVRAIREQLEPPKPAEPGKYGAVVAGDGREWIRYTTSERRGRDWCRPDTDDGTEYAAWDDLDVIRVTNEGVRDV